MEAQLVVTLILVAVLCAALAAYLTVIAYTLYRTSFTLGTILIGVRSIANQTEPVEEVVAGIAENISGISDALEGLANKLGQTHSMADR
ncbi:hypothetical protein BH20ACT2_BH20ACT2_01300 [soil metagenome]